MEKSQRRVAREKHSFPFPRCQGPSPIRQQPWCGLPLSLAAALALVGCASPTYEQTHDSLSALSSVLGVVAAAVPGASAVGLAGQSLSTATTLTGAASPGSPSHASAREGTETVYDGAYHVKG